MIFRIPFFLPLLYPSLTWRIPTKEKELYLTFDDGPMPGPTDWVLDELAKFNALATFFCIGDNVRKHPERLNKIIDKGHTVGNHTFNHVKGWSTTVHDYVSNTQLCQDQLNLENLGNAKPLFRPPYGRITRLQINALSDYKIIMWDVLTHDYASNISAQRCLMGSIRATRPGSIVVFHDSLKAEKTLTAVLPGFLQHFSELGYTFKPIPNS